MTRKGFTLLEVLIALAIFTVVMTMVLMTVAGSFKSLRQAQIFMLKEQKQRMCLYNLGKEVSSFTKVDHPTTRFEGENSSFFLSMPWQMISLKPDTFIIPREEPLSGIQKFRLIMTGVPIR
jgi:prepilin-type N-terminal cleavage/methylation domain-containing protein